MSKPLITERTFLYRQFPAGVLATMNDLLFSASEPGAWYDPSDLSTLFQDAAGTTPVTAVEQPVGGMLDKSGRGNHATQATTTKRPVLSARYGLIAGTEMTGGAGGAPGTAPDQWQLHVMNGTYAHTIENGKHRFTASGGRSTVRAPMTWLPGVSYDINLDLINNNSNTSVYSVVYAGLQSGTGVSLVPYVDGVVSSTIPPGMHTIKIVCSFTGGTAHPNLYIGAGAAGTATADITALKCSVTRDQDAHLPYQWVNTASDYDADPAKFPAYRRLDGVDDSHASATGGGGTSGFFFSAAVTPQGGAGTARTLFSDAGTNTGYIVRLNTGNQLELSAGNGTAYTTIATSGALAVGTTDVVQAWDDGTNLNVKIGNGATASVARPVVSAGTAGYTMGQDNGASTGYFNGRIHSTIYRKDSGLKQVQREAVALYQRQKARMP